MEQLNIYNEYLQLIKGKAYEYTENRRPIDFIGPSSFTLQLANIVPETVSSKIPNIRNIILFLVIFFGIRIKLIIINKRIFM